MKYLKIQNDGELDVRLISLMGGTTKSGNSYKIGRFGTGLKYSLSFLIRNNIDFKIFVGEKEIPIETKSEVIQGTDFEILYIDGERSSISSSMGLDWEAWMIVREIWCNALDEGGSLREITENVTGEKGKTTFYLQNTSDIKQVTDKWSDYFIHDMKPIYENKENDFAIYPASDILKIYKQGVLIHQDKSHKSVFSYDIKTAPINELREYRGSLTYDLVGIIKNLDKNCVELFLSSLKKDCYEYDMDYDWSMNFSKSWTEAIGQAKIISQKDIDSFKARQIPVDESSCIIVPDGLFKKLATEFPSISAVRRADKVSSFYETFDANLELKIKQGLVILETCGYFVNPELKFIYGVFGDPSVWAKINTDEKCIMFSQELSRKSLFEIVTTIVEENEHFVSGFVDCTRNFQQHFINLYTKTLLDLHEVKL